MTAAPAGGRLLGKVAVVTGGASGIGLAVVERFVAEGASVVFCDLPVGDDGLLDRLGAAASRLHHRRRAPGGVADGVAIAARLGEAPVFVPADVTDPAQLAAVIDTAIERFGGLDVLVGNAGVGGSEGSIVDCDDAVFDRVVDVDLKAVWRGIKLAAPHLEARGGGSIISTASVAALVGFGGLGAYGAAKAGVVQLTRVAAVELAPHLVRVNCIVPGAILTPLLYDSPTSDAAVDPEVARASLAAAQPLPRAGEATDVANAALWLASDEASFVTGQSIVVDGGLTIEANTRPRRRP